MAGKSIFSRSDSFMPIDSYAQDFTQLRLFNGPEVGRAHSRSLGLLGNKHPAYIELSDDPRVLNDLDEVIATFVYVQIRREKNRKKNGSGAAAVGGAA